MKKFLKSIGINVKIPSICSSNNIDIDKILYCKAEGSYTTVFFKNNKKILLTKRIYLLQKELSNDIFFRCHKSYLININYVSELFVENPCIVILNGTAIIDVSIRRKNDLIKLLQKDSLLIAI